MSQVGSRYTVSTTTDLEFAEAVARVREELAQEGFGILCEIDVQATLKQKLGVDREPYLILGACNPPLAHAALEAEPELGALLPCNVVVYEQHGETHIAAVDAEQMLSIVGNDELASTATEVRRRLADIVDRARTSRKAITHNELRTDHGSQSGRLAATARAPRPSSDLAIAAVPDREDAPHRRRHTIRLATGLLLSPVAEIP